jgi:hypothetical protein
MVRVPASFRQAGFAGLSGSGLPGVPKVRPIRVAPIIQYNDLVTVDIGNDGSPSSATSTFLSGGTAYAYCGPGGLGQSWSLDQCYLSSSVGPLDASQVIVYVGPWMGPQGAVAQYAVTSSLAGGGSQFGMGGLTLDDGWFVQAYWTGGTPGAIAYLRVTGTKTALRQS